MSKSEKSSKSSKTEKAEKPEKVEKSEKTEKSSKSEKPEKTDKAKTTKKTSTFNTSTVWPSQIIAAHKVHGDAMCRIETTKKPKTYGEGTRQISVFQKLVNVSTKKDEEEWHPACIEILNTKTSGWVNGGFENTDQKADTKKDSKSGKSSKSKKAKDDDDEEAEGDGDGEMKPKIPFAKSTKFTRPADEGEGEVEEPLGEAMWLLSEIYQKLVDGYFKDRDSFTKIFGGRKKNQFSPFKLYRKYKPDTDDKDAIIEIDGVDKIKLEDPYFQVNIRCGKNGDLGAGVSFKDITDKSKIKQKGEYYEFPNAKINGALLTPKTVGKFITPGSMCTGIIAFDQLKTHSFGFSQPVEMGWQKVSAADEKSQQVFFVRRVAQEGGKTKMDNKGRTLAMLGTTEVGGGSDSEDEKEDAKKKAQKAIIKEARSQKDTKKDKGKKGAKEEKSGSGSESSSGSGSDDEESNNDDSDASGSEESSEKKPKKGKETKESKDDKKGSKDKKGKETKETKESKDDKKGKDSKSKKSKKEEKEDATESADGSSSGSSASVSDIADDE